VTAVQHQAALHPAAVTEISRQPITRPRRTPTSVRPAQRVTSRQIHPLAWAAALAGADGDAQRIEELEDGTLYVHNSRDWRSHR
jgi:hypothetical protein